MYDVAFTRFGQLILPSSWRCKIITKTFRIFVTVFANTVAGWLPVVNDEEDVSRYSVTLRKREDLAMESGSTRWHCLENSRWYWPRSCLKTD
jgi:hypothetical protein